MPAIGIQHVDLAVGDVGRSLAFYLAVLGPLGLTERYRMTTYRATEEVIYLEFGTGQIFLVSVVFVNIFYGAFISCPHNGRAVACR